MSVVYQSRVLPCPTSLKGAFDAIASATTTSSPTATTKMAAATNAAAAESVVALEVIELTAVRFWAAVFLLIREQVPHELTL